MDLGINEMKKIIDNPAYSRGYKYSLHALIDMSIKYLNISKKNMEMNEAQYIQEKIIAIPKKEMDSYILSGIKQYISYCQDHGCEEICAPIIIRHYEDIPFMEKATEAKEIARLQRELRDTKDALEVLKKAIGILGK